MGLKEQTTLSPFLPSSLLPSLFLPFFSPHNFSFLASAKNSANLGIQRQVLLHSPGPQ